LSKIFLLFLFVITLNAKTFSIATYNVENLFDLNKDDNEYSEFIPNTPSKWNETNFNIKINNLIKVIKDMNVDILALQEIENRELIQLLLKKLPEYKYYSFIKYPDSAIGIGFLSKIEIKENTNLDVKFRNKTI
jgi:predicted extracellular nuclease